MWPGPDLCSMCHIDLCRQALTSVHSMCHIDFSFVFPTGSPTLLQMEKTYLLKMQNSHAVCQPTGTALRSAQPHLSNPGEDRRFKSRSRFKAPFYCKDEFCTETCMSHKPGAAYLLSAPLCDSWRWGPYSQIWHRPMVCLGRQQKARGGRRRPTGGQ